MSTVIVGDRVLLPAHSSPVPATIVIDDTGKIVDVQSRRRSKEDFQQSTSIKSWIDAGDLVVLPGLVESVVFASSRLLYAETITAVPMYTSTSQEGRTGKGSGREQERLRQGGSQQ